MDSVLDSEHCLFPHKRLNLVVLTNPMAFIIKVTSSGIFLEVIRSGIITLSVGQSNWNVDKMDGTMGGKLIKLYILMHQLIRPH